MWHVPDPFCTEMERLSTLIFSPGSDAPIGKGRGLTFNLDNSLHFRPEGSTQFGQPGLAVIGWNSVGSHRSGAMLLDGLGGE